jgi:hypothetical protein
VIPLVNLILWEIDSAFVPQTPEDRIQLWTQLQQWVKTDLASKRLTTWGVTLSTMQGFALSELEGEALYLALSKYTPIVTFTVKQTLTIDQAIAALQTMQQQR